MSDDRKYGNWAGESEVIVESDDKTEKQAVSLWRLGHALRDNLDGQAYLLERVLNGWSNPIQVGEEIGKRFAYAHRTIQANLVGFALGLLVGYASEATGSDDRNKTALESARKVKTLVETGELSRGYFI